MTDALAPLMRGGLVGSVGVPSTAHATHDVADGTRLVRCVDGEHQGLAVRQRRLLLDAKQACLAL